MERKEELPEKIRLALTLAGPDESPAAETASLFLGDHPFSPHERRVFSLLKADAATDIDAIVERLDAELSSSEILAAWFE